jgi:hypothetical protein
MSHLNKVWVVVFILFVSPLLLQGVAHPRSIPLPLQKRPSGPDGHLPGQGVFGDVVKKGGHIP